MKKIVFIFPIGTILFMWIIFIVQYILGIDFGVLGIHPRDTSFLLGILTAPLIHGNWEHLISNTLPLFIFGMLLSISYNKVAVWVWCLNYIFTGLFVWLFARDSYHIGASGIIYGLASFLFFSGFFRMDIKAIAITTGVAIFYGGMVWGVLPIQKGISWESHLFGGIVGFFLSYLFKNIDKDTLIVEHELDNKKRKTFSEFIQNKEDKNYL